MVIPRLGLVSLFYFKDKESFGNTGKFRSCIRGKEIRIDSGLFRLTFTVI